MLNLRSLLCLAFAFLSLTGGQQVLAADIPASVRAMIDAAMEEKDPKAMDLVVKLARKTNPNSVEEINSLYSRFKQTRAKQAKSEARKRELAVRRAGVFDIWKGKAELGAYLSTGNSRDVGGTIAINLQRKGLDWTHSIKTKADYKSSDGSTSRERYELAYQPRYNINERTFTYGLMQFERDRITGFNSRLSVSTGAGFTPIKEEGLELSLEAGPAYRRTDYVEDETTNHLAGRFGMKMDWKVAGHVSFVQDFAAFAEKNNNTISSTTGLEVGLNSKLKTRFSYAVEYDSNPDDDSETTDTMTRFTLVHAF